MPLTFLLLFSFLKFAYSSFVAYKHRFMPFQYLSFSIETRINIMVSFTVILTEFVRLFR